MAKMDILSSAHNFSPHCMMPMCGLSVQSPHQGLSAQCWHHTIRHVLAEKSMKNTKWPFEGNFDLCAPKGGVSHQGSGQNMCRSFIWQPLCNTFKAFFDCVTRRPVHEPLEISQLLPNSQNHCQRFCAGKIFHFDAACLHQKPKILKTRAAAHC